MRSMTGYGKCTVSKNDRVLTIELKTVNNRFLDVNIRLPRSIMYLEDSVRKQLAEKINQISDGKSTPEVPHRAIF